MVHSCVTASHVLFPVTQEKIKAPIVTTDPHRFNVVLKLTKNDLRTDAIVELLMPALLPGWTLQNRDPHWKDELGIVSIHQPRCNKALQILL